MFLNNTDYLIYDTAKKECILVFTKDAESKYWLLGDSIFRGYYLIFDMDA